MESGEESGEFSMKSHQLLEKMSNDVRDEEKKGEFLK